MDVIINNAGLMPHSLLEHAKVDDWERRIDVNRKGVLYGIAAAMPHMIRQNNGHIINVASHCCRGRSRSGYLPQLAHDNRHTLLDHADVVAGADLQNCIKQAAEFGIAKGGELLATLLLEINDVLSIGQDACQGLVLPSSFYRNLSPATRTWAARYVENEQAAAHGAGLCLLRHDALAEGSEGGEDA